MNTVPTVAARPSDCSDDGKYGMGPHEVRVIVTIRGTTQALDTDEARALIHALIDATLEAEYGAGHIDG